MPQFHETIYGKIFFDQQLPGLIKAITALTEELKLHRTDAPACKACNDTGNERYMDAGGSRDYRDCTKCNRTPRR